MNKDFEKYSKEIMKDKESALSFMKRVGIYDDNGIPSENYFQKNIINKIKRIRKLERILNVRL